jgi:prepilin-type processing-associated H-X9-DG protein
MLAVVAVVAILAALLGPAVIRARDKGTAAACISNVRQIGVAVALYAAEFGDNLPDRRWEPGPHVNNRGLWCGGEWTHTPAAYLAHYGAVPSVWVCPKKRRGLHYASEPGGFDPTVTGFLSYGFNYLGVFGGASSGVKFKQSLIERPSEVVSVTEINGAEDPRSVGGGVGNGHADAAWLDGFWAGGSFPERSTATGNENFRFQSQSGKHGKRVLVLFIDGHAAPLKASKLVWGQWYNVFAGPSTISGTPKLWNGPVSSPDLDEAEIRVE